MHRQRYEEKAAGAEKVNYSLNMAEADLLIEPRRGRNEALLPACAVLVVNPTEAEQAIQMFRPLAGLSRTLYQTEILVDKDNSLCLAGPALGAPAAVLVLEKLIVLGGQTNLAGQLLWGN